MGSIKRHFAHVPYDGDELNIHYRQYNHPHEESETVILLHPSPLSSGFMLPMIELFGQYTHVIALDTPGNGESDPLSGKVEGLSGFTGVLASFLEELNLGSVIIYGNATGAQIAIEFAKAYPEKVSRLLLENVAWFYPEEHDSLFGEYFPSLSPQSDGQHLSLAWSIASSLFCRFPWYEADLDAEDTNIPPKEVIHQTVMDYLKAGNGYDLAYRAALNNERPEQLAMVERPTDIVLWPDSIIYPYCKRLTTASLPENIRIHETATGLDSRLQYLERLIKKE